MGNKLISNNRRNKLIWRILDTHSNYFSRQCTEFPLWLSGNESDWYPWGCRFNPWPRSMGYRSCIAVNCGVGHRCSSDLVWLWCRLAAIAPIWHLDWELPHVSGEVLKRPKTNNPQKPKNVNTQFLISSSPNDFYNWKPLCESMFYWVHHSFYIYYLPSDKFAT